MELDWRREERGVGWVEGRERRGEIISYAESAGDWGGNESGEGG